jgi:hypothetical protein
MPLSDKEIEHRVRRRAAVKRIREFIATKSAVNYDQTPYARELRRRIQAQTSKLTNISLRNWAAQI